MEQKIKELYSGIRDVAAMYLIYQDRKIVEAVREYLPSIQEFSSWFLETNSFGIDEELYQELSINLLNILKDIIQAMNQEDMVLLNDALAYGFIDYLEIFMGEEQEEISNDAV